MAETTLDDLLATLYAETSGQQALSYVRMIWEQDRWSNFGSYARTARNIEDTFKQIGLADVQRIETPADGRHRVGDWVMPMAWECADGHLRITSPDVSEPVLVRRFDTPNCVGMWSGPTPSDGFEGELIFLDKGTPDEIESHPADFNNRWVVTPGQAREVKMAVTRAGGIGVITCWSRNPDRTDVVPWVNGWSDRPGGWMFTATDTPLPCFSISRQMHRRLKDLRDRHGSVRVCGRVDAHHHSGHLDYVTARIVGRDEPEKEVLVLGHLYEQGANDNASGCATIIEMARTFHRLIESGRLPRPRRSIRFLLMAECYGSLAYAQDHRDRIANTIVASCIDTGAGRPEYSRASYQINLAPLCSLSFYEPVHIRTVSAYLSKHRPLRHLKVTPFGMGTDQEYNDPVLGVPTHWQYIGSETDLWHHSGDDLRTVYDDAYVDLVCGEGATLYSIANADDTDATLFARWTAAYVKTQVLERMAGTRAAGVEQIGGATDNRVPLAGTMTPSALEVWREIGAAAILSVQKLTGNIGPAEQLARQYEEFLTAEAELVATIAPASPAPASAASSESAAADESAGRSTSDTARPGRTGAKTGPATSGAAGSPDAIASRDQSHAAASRHEAVRLIPARNEAIFGTVALDAIPVEQWAEGGVTRSPRWGGPLTLSLWWADGNRTIAEIEHHVAAEVPLGDVDLVRWFHFLSKHDYVELYQAGR